MFDYVSAIICITAIQPWEQRLFFWILTGFITVLPRKVSGSSFEYSSLPHFISQRSVSVNLKVLAMKDVLFVALSLLRLLGQLFYESLKMTKLDTNTLVEVDVYWKNDFPKYWISEKVTFQKSDFPKLWSSERVKLRKSDISKKCHSERVTF